MALKTTVQNLEDVEASFRGLYTKVGDVYVLDTDDGEYKTRLSEFRNNNIELARINDELGKKAGSVDQLMEQLKAYEGLDPETAREAVTQFEAMREKKLIDAGKLDEVVEERINKRLQLLNKDHSAKVAALENALNETKTTADTFKNKLSEVVIDSSLQSAVTTVAPVRKGAMMDILSRGRQVFKLDESGAPVPRDSNGDIMFGKDGKNPMSMEEWSQSLLQDASYLFEPNSGGGAGGNDDSSHSSGAVSAVDQGAINANIEAIAKGDVRVVDAQ